MMISDGRNIRLDRIIHVKLKNVEAVHAAILDFLSDFPPTRKSRG